MLLRQNTLKPNRKRSMTHLRLLTTVLTPSCNSEVRLQLQKEKGHYVLHQRNEAHVNPTYQSRLSAGCASTRPRRKEREEKNKVKPGERERTRCCGMSSKKSREDDDDDEGFWLRCLLFLSVTTLHTLRAPTLTLYFCPGNSHPPAQPKRLPVIITCTARSPLWKGNKLSHTPLTVPPTPSNTGVFLINP